VAAVASLPADRWPGPLLGDRAVADTTTLDVVLSLFRPSGEFDGWVLPRASIACVWVLEREMASVAAHGHLSAGAR
jgi:hypothetical protein